VVEKTFIQAQDLLEDSFRLGIKVLESGFRPTFVAGVWRGGAPVGIAVHELLNYAGIPADPVAIRTSAYEGIGKMKREVRVHGLGILRETLTAEDRLLVVDDVYDTGLSIRAVLTALRETAAPAEIRVATVYYKPGRNQTDRVPDYFIHCTDKWLVFPHELAGLSPSEIGAGKRGIHPLVRDLAPPPGNA
jgi:hypoxanthine phosphoribosyltransferase